MFFYIYSNIVANRNRLPFLPDFSFKRYFQVSLSKDHGWSHFLYATKSQSNGARMNCVMTSPEFRMFVIHSLSIILTKMAKEWIAKNVKRYDLLLLLQSYVKQGSQKNQLRIQLRRQQKSLQTLLRLTIKIILKISSLKTFTYR